MKNPPVTEADREASSGTVYRIDLDTVNAYLVDDDQVTLVDTGTPWSGEKLRQGLEQAGYAEEDIDRVLITHFDLDHVGMLADLQFEGPIYAMEPDASFLDGSQKPPLSNPKGMLQRVMDFWVTRPSRSIDRVDDGATVGNFTAYHTPGHTPGHAIYVHESLGVGFLGDLFIGEDDGFSTLPGILMYSFLENAESVRKLASHDLTFDIAAMSHGDPVTENVEAALDNFVRRLD